MMICTIDCRTHKVRCTCINSDVFLIDMLLMNCLSYKTAIWSKHKSSKLCIDCNITHSGRNKYFFVYFADTLTDLSDIIRSLIWFVSDSNTTGKVDKLHMSACLFLKFHCHFKHLFRQHRIILICHSIACKECMDTEFLGTFFLQNLECFKNLFCCHTIFGISRIISFAYLNSSSGVSLEENMISPSLHPIALDIINSVMEEQSQPQPYS